MKPKHIHNCKSCEYLETILIRNKEVDWYICPSEFGGSIIGRDSDEGSDYWSMAVDILKTVDTLGSKHMEYAKKILEKYGERRRN